MGTTKVANLPPNVLREIFARGAIYGMTVDDKAERVQLRATLSAVCRQWRDVVTNASLLWSLVYISLGRLPSREAWDLHTTRSGTQGLDITVRAGSVALEQEKSQALRAMALLLPHIKRWKLIHVSLQDIVVVRDAVAQWKGAADVLDEIFLSSEPDCESDSAAVTLDPGFVAPQLRVFALYDIPVVRGGKDLHLRFPALHELSLVRSTFEEAPGVANWARLMPLLVKLKHLRLLNLCPEDEDEDDEDEDEDEAEADSDEEDESPAPSPSSVPYLPYLPTLSKLVLHNTPLPALNKLLRAFTAPALSTLELVSCDPADGAARQLRSTRALLRRGFPALHTLRFENAPRALTLAAMRLMADGVPPRLELEEADVDKVLAFVTKRAVQGGRPRPRLRSLEVRVGEAARFGRKDEDEEDEDEDDDEEDDEDEDADEEAEEKEKENGKEEKNTLAPAIRKLAEACTAAHHPLESIIAHTKAECPEGDRTWFEKNVPKFSWAPPTDSRAAYLNSVTLEYGPKA